MKYSTDIYVEFLSSKSTCTKIEKVHNFTYFYSKSNYISSSILINLHGIEKRRRRRRKKEEDAEEEAVTANPPKIIIHNQTQIANPKSSSIIKP